jgi:hypothetical protein
MNVTVHTMAGRSLPRDWQAQAANNAISFDEELRHRLENRWRAPLTTTNNSPIIGARLSRQDSRMDALRLVKDDEQEEVWQAPGVRVIRRKSNGK